MKNIAVLGDVSRSTNSDDPCAHCAAVRAGRSHTGSPDVRAAGRPVLRAGDVGQVCPHRPAGGWYVAAGASGVFVNGRRVARTDDPTLAGGTPGAVVGSTTTVFVGDAHDAALVGARGRIIVRTRVNAFPIRGVRVEAAGVSRVTDERGEARLDVAPGMVDVQLNGQDAWRVRIAGGETFTLDAVAPLGLITCRMAHTHNEGGGNGHD